MGCENILQCTTPLPKFAQTSISMYRQSSGTSFPYDLVPNPKIYDECQTQSAYVLDLPLEWAHQDDSNDTM